MLFGNRCFANLTMTIVCLYICSTRFSHMFCDYGAGLLLLHVCLLYLMMLDVILFCNVVISFCVQKVLHNHKKTHEHFMQLKEFQISAKLFVK